MQIKSIEAKEKLVNRLRRIEGQVRGVQAMLDEERDCKDILQQLSAIRSAVQGVSRAFLQEYATACLLDVDDSSREKKEQLIQDMIQLLDKAP